MTLHQTNNMPAPKQRLVGELDRRSVADVYEQYRAPEGDYRTVQIIRPFSVTSKNAYSAPVTLPIGPAYLASVLGKAGYQVEAIDGVGEKISTASFGPPAASTIFTA